MDKSWKFLAVLSGVLVAGMMGSGPSHGQQCNPNPNLYKNCTPLTFMQPRGVTYAESTDRIYIASRFGNARRYTKDLQPAGFIVPPGNFTNREIAGIAWFEHDDSLVWLDIGNNQIHHTTMLGITINSYPFTLPAAAQGGDIGDIAIANTAPFPDPNPVMYLPIGDNVHYLTTTGVDLMEEFSVGSPVFCPTRGVASRKDNKDVEVPKWKTVLQLCVEKFDSTTGLSAGTPQTDISAFGDCRGLEWVADGSDGQGSFYIASETDQAAYEIMAGERFSESFVRGDANDDGNVNISDPVATLVYLFSAGSLTCVEAADSNDDDTVNIADAVATLTFLFPTGPGGTIAEPFPYCGEDKTGAAAPDCVSSDACP